MRQRHERRFAGEAHERDAEADRDIGRAKEQRTAQTDAAEDARQTACERAHHAFAFDDAGEVRRLQRERRDDGERERRGKDRDTDADAERNARRMSQERRAEDEHERSERERDVQRDAGGEVEQVDADERQPAHESDTVRGAERYRTADVVRAHRFDQRPRGQRTDEKCEHERCGGPAAGRGGMRHAARERVRIDRLAACGLHLDRARDFRERVEYVAVREKLHEAQWHGEDEVDQGERNEEAHRQVDGAVEHLAETQRS